MTNIYSLPEEVLLEIFTLLPRSSLISVWRTCRQWRNLTNKPLAARIQASWVEGDQWAGDGTPLPQYYPSAAEVRCAAALAASGHLTEVEYMQLEDLELPSIEDKLSLTRVVSVVSG